MRWWLFGGPVYEFRSLPTWSRFRVLSEKSGAFAAIVVLIGLLSAWPAFKGELGQTAVVADVERLAINSTFWIASAIVLFISAALTYGINLSTITASSLHHNDWVDARLHNHCVSRIINDADVYESESNILLGFWDEEETRAPLARLSITVLSAASIACLFVALATMAVAVYRVNAHDEPSSESQVEIVAAPENPPTPEDAMMN